ncbi:anti-sigma factor [Comamonas testosteroni]|uniref:Anti-sigma factor n=1 Tax=Comamonas testosteroni TaxID=285 RepID=A0A096HTA2_COMTE|nr:MULTISPECIES: sigma-E factor negative regulatory protein [Comamonas]KGH32182.1 anti-sigma factor [Comamonas testosteroni]KOC20216.1 anti-sigma factor [Comamonas testosteroni]MPT08950.1 anti-sigma factor [Comamonas sp.]
MNDDLIKQEQLSALVDGEASSVQMQAVLSYAESDEGQQSWAMYHLIGDVLRSPELAHHSQHDILSRVRAHMEREPIRGIHLPGVTADAASSLGLGGLEQITEAQERGQAQGNGATVVGLPARQAANASVFRWKMAAGFASVAAVAAVGWGVMLAGSGGLYGRQGGAQLAALSPNAVVAVAPAASLGLSQPVSGGEETAMPLGSEAQSSTVVAVAGPNGQTVMLRDPRLDELLASHPQQSSAPNLQMPASFLRNASFATATRH